MKRVITEIICEKLEAILEEVETKVQMAEAEYKKLLESFELEFEEEFLTLNETEIAKLLQKKKEASLKVQIDNSLGQKWQLKQTLKDTESDIKVDLTEETGQGPRGLRLQNPENGETQRAHPKLQFVAIANFESCEHAQIAVEV